MEAKPVSGTVVSAPPAAMQMERAQVVGGPFSPETMFPGGTIEWNHGFCACKGADTTMLIVASVCCNMCLPCLECVWGSQFQGALGSKAGFTNCCCGFYFGQYATGKMSHALGIREDIDARFCFEWACCYICNFLRFKAEAEDKVEALKHLDKAGTQPWKQPLFSCCDDPLLAALVCCVPCIPMGQFYEKFGKNCFLYGLCGCFCLEYTHGKVVAAKGIQEPFFDHAVKQLCCGPCAACQLFAELKDHDPASAPPPVTGTVVTAAPA
eukprot:CAMPEP_0198656768 /NCGR_PEP_ID=MMETSP1467-20131203/10908_1 /TAXON_ID=1462469 /ORGANISM="unid. sp., Strain CCMP2135" /LENGTH=266 /DNA_ID=CAMNT_0044392843 /DNA_START=45 /DNA_END=845 /DNA_ORIENTATION=+